MSGSITYDSKTLSVPKITSVVPRLMQERSDNYSESRKHEALAFDGWIEIDVSVARLTLDQYYAFHAWLAWALLGELFAFAKDADRTGDTTLDDAAAAGQKVVPLLTTAAFTATDYALIKEASGDDYEVVRIDAVNAGVSVETVNNLVYSYAEDDIFRHVHYWPHVSLKQKEFPLPMEGKPFYDISFTLIEEK